MQQKLKYFFTFKKKLKTNFCFFMMNVCGLYSYFVNFLREKKKLVKICTAQHLRIHLTELANFYPQNM